VYLTRAWFRYMAGQAEAADQQPWRCFACGEAVSLIRHNDCRCIRAARAALAPPPSLRAPQGATNARADVLVGAPAS
jgi:hypothetical protein